jgi:hypothetical protein
MRIDPLDFSQARTAPESVVRGLEGLDPSACIIHLGGAQWLVGKWRPSSAARADAEAMFDNWTRNVSEGRRMTPRGKLRVRFAQLALLGVRPVQQYTLIGAPDDRIVHDFERSRFRWLHSADNALEKAGDAADEARATASAQRSRERRSRERRLEVRLHDVAHAERVADAGARPEGGLDPSRPQ